jgi:hypothetical protein
MVREGEQMRHTANYTVTAEGRDKGKLYVITEMSAEQGESWATRALLAIMAGNIDLPENFESLGMAALASLGVRALASLKWEVAKPLLDEMFECIQIIPDKKKTHVSRDLIESDIEEIPTRFQLRLEWWKLHMGFLTAVLPSLGDTAKKTTASITPIAVSPKP